jgi:protocatechuate 3,4-dioxygenase beta subunit
VRGLVTTQDGTPLEGATVRLRRAVSNKREGEPTDKRKIDADPSVPLVVRTGEDGRFVAAGLEGERFWLRVEAVGFAPFKQEAVPAHAVVTVRLEPGERLAGRVVSHVDGAPLAGVEVRGCDTDHGGFGEEACETTHSGEDGSFLLRSLPPGAHWIRAWGPGLTIARHLALLPAKPQPGTDEPRPVLMFLGPGTEVSGTVVDGEGSPVKGARVEIRTAEGLERLPGSEKRAFTGYAERTEADGVFEIEGVPLGARYALTVRAKGFATLEEEIEIREPFTEPVKLSLSAGAFFTVRLVTSDEEPVTDAELRMQADRAARRSSFDRHGQRIDDGRIERADDGRLTVGPLPARTIALEILPAGHRAERRDGIRLREGETVDLGTIVVRVGGVVSGRVTDAAGEPIKDARVRAGWRTKDRYRSRSFETAEDGTYRAAGLPEHDPVDIHVYAEGFASAEREAVRPGTRDVDFSMIPTGVIKGRVRRPDGDVPEEFSAEAKREAEGARGGFAFAGGPGKTTRGNRIENPDGTLEIEGLEAGTYTVRASGKGWAAVTKAEVEVTAGKTTDVGTLVLERGLTLRGRVVTADGTTPVAGATVTAAPPRGMGMGLFGADPSAPFARSGLDGVFALEGLSPGALTVEATHPDYSPTELNVQLEPDVEPEEIVLALSAGGAIEGTVRDGSGQPVPGVSILIMRGMMAGQLDSANTDETGRYQFERLAAGSYTVVRAPDNPDDGMADMQMKNAMVGDGETTIVDFDETPEIRMSGRLLRNGDPVGDVRLVFMKGGEFSGDMSGFRTTTVDADGNYVVGFEKPGSYNVVVQSGGGRGGGFGTGTVSVDVPEQAEVRRDIHLGGVQITGTVTDPEGNPLAGAYVGAQRDGGGAMAGNYGAETDDAGRYTLEVEPGTYRMRAASESYPAVERFPVTVVEGGTQTVDFRLETGRGIRGRVVDPNGTGVEGAFVMAGPSGASSDDFGSAMATTDMNGGFELTVSGEGPFDVTAWSPAWAPAMVAGVRPTDEDDAGFVIRVSTGGRLRARVVTAEGEPAPGLQLRLEPLTSFPGAAMAVGMIPPPITDASGQATFTKLAAGRYRVHVVGNDDVAAVEVEVPDGGEGSTTLTLPPG